MPNLPGSVVTFLFTDIEGSSRLWDVDADAMRPAHRNHHEILISAIERNGGSIVKDLGDGFMTVFENPLEAPIAAAEGQRALREADWSGLGQELKVRMGVHTGPAEKRSGDF